MDQEHVINKSRNQNPDSTNQVQSDKDVETKSSTKQNEKKIIQKNSSELLYKNNHSIWWYLLGFAILHFSKPYLTEQLYERSKIHIQWVQQYKNPITDQLMYLYSDLGTGEPYYVLFVLFWSRNINSKMENSFYTMNYFLLSFFLGLFFCYSLKPVYHESRPFFDDISLGDLNIKDCSAEFGNPSAHSILAGQIPLVLMWYYLDTYRDYFNKNKFLKFSLKAFTWSFILGVIYSRVYVGRHSFDQIIYGVLLGILLAYFSHYYFRQNIFDPTMRDDLTSGECRYHAQIAVYLLMGSMVLSHLLFYYIENYVDIPQQWFDNSRIVCPNIRKTDLFHWNTVAGFGYLFYPAMFYIYKAYCHSVGQPLKFKYQEGEKESRASFMEFFVKCTLCIISDQFATQVLPIGIYGTKNITMHQDMFIKKGSFALMMSWLVNSQMINHFLISMLRTKEVEQEDTKQKIQITQ